MELRQVQQQSLKLKMTAELKQAISMLRFSTQELRDFLYEQVAENPLIDIKESVDDFGHFHIRPHGHGERKTDVLNLIPTDAPDFREDLMQQARLTITDPSLLKIVSYFISLLDDDGYFREDIIDVSDQLDVPFSVAMKALECLQALDPPGIGARSVKECLLLQIDRMKPNRSLAKEIIENHLEELASGDLMALSERLGTSLEAVQEAVSDIRALNPKPVRFEPSKRTPYIRPDLIVVKRDGQYDIALVEPLPKIYFNHHYDEWLERPASSEAEMFIHQKYRHYTWLVKSIEQRRKTVLNVTRAIMERQGRFLEWGPKALAPLTLKDIANDLNIHESTVSRAAREKYVQTPHGIFELRRFFSSEVKTHGSRGISATSVKILIRELVEAEDRRQPLSDQAIANALKWNQGIVISRRAIAKYRSELNIPSSSKRKQVSM